MGIGTSVSHHLVEGIARAGRGTADFVTSQQRLERAVIQQLKYASSTVFDDVEVNWKFPEGCSSAHSPSAMCSEIATLAKALAL